MRQVIIGGLAGALLGAAPAAAHHSFAVFDPDKTVEIAGTVKEFQYTNPHSWVLMDVTQPDGSVTVWSFESEGPSTLLRNGIKKSALLPGDKVTAEAHPMRDGRHGGSLISITKADGSRLVFHAGGPPRPAPAAAP